MPRFIRFSVFSRLSASFRRVAALTVKEFYVVLLDKKSRAQLFVAPLLMLFVFSFAVTMEVKNASLALLNQDSGELGRLFASYFSFPSQEPAKQPFSRVFELKGTGEIRPAVENQRALMVLHIPEDFSKKLISGQSVTVQLILDGRKINAAQIAAGYADAVARQFSQAMTKYAAPEKASAAFDVATRFLFNPNQSYLWFTLPVLLVLLTQMSALVVSGMSVARERELGTFDQLLVSPLASVEIVTGKAIPAVFFALCEGAAIHAIALTVFKVPFTGNLALLAACFGLFILSAAGVGLFISSLCATQQQAFLGCFAYMAPAVLLSGFVAPIENMPRALQLLTLLNPVRHIIEAVPGIYLKGAPLSDVLPEMIRLGCIAAAALSFAAWFFKRKTR